MMPSIRVNPAFQPTVDQITKALNNGEDVLLVWGSGLIRISIAAKNAERAIKLIDLLISQLAKHGYPMVQFGDHLGFMAKDQRECVFRLREKIRKIKRAATAQALKKSRDYIEKVGRVRADGSSEYQNYDQYYSGEFELIFDKRSPYLRERWSDQRKKRLEGQIDELIAEILSVEDNKKREELRAERQRRAQLEYYRPYLVARIEKSRMVKRDQYLEEIMKRCQRLNDLKAWYGGVRSSIGSSNQPQLRQYLDWVELKIADVERSISADTVQKELKSRQIMDPVDPLSLTDDEIEDMINEYYDFEAGAGHKPDWPPELLRAADMFEDHLPYDDPDHTLYIGSSS